MVEGRDAQGYIWIKEARYDDYFYLQDFEHLVVAKAGYPKEHWEALIFEDETCSKVVGRQEFMTEAEAKGCLEAIMELTLKNRREIDVDKMG